ncbi:MAG: hypothetical protein VX225_06870 [Pseudomonadota bacterium]|nr:hypothetical protein [Pseudomonadota bacterium]
MSGEPQTGTGNSSSRANALPREPFSVGQRVSWLELSPSIIRLSVGDTYDLRQVKIVAHGRAGLILTGVPLNVGIEGRLDLLAHDNANTQDNLMIELKAARAGLARLWIQSTAPNSNGERPRQSIVLLVED